MNIQFFKYEGAGNDFIMIDNRKKDFIPNGVIVKKLCDRHFGIGADGIILLENDKKHTFSMRYYNADGYEGTMCGNGGRCFAWFANNLGIAQNKTLFRATDGLHHAEINALNNSEAIVKLKMNDVEIINYKNNYRILNTGSPHLIITVNNIENIDVFGQGRKIRYSAPFEKEGINVNFVSILDGKIAIRTYERGVENETLACGTGAVASALVALHEKEVVSPVTVYARGGNLKVYASQMAGKFFDVWLEGQTKSVFEGTISI